MNDANKSQSNFSRKLLYIVLPLFVIFLGWFGWMVKEKYFPPKEVHYHAGFIVVNNNKQVDFSDIKYMHTKPCGEEEEHEENPEEKQLHKAHLHDQVGDVVHVHVDGAKWKDFFTNLKYPIDYSHAEVYVDGHKVINFNSSPIKPYESIVIFTGENNDTQKYLEKAVKRPYIEEIEKKSDNCGS